MIETRSIAQLLEADRLSPARDAIVATLDALLMGVHVRGHPGKLDVADVLQGDIVPTPGILVGWTRIRAAGATAGHFAMSVDWAAYIAVEDYADRGAQRRYDREVVGMALGRRLVAILHDDDVPSWGLDRVGFPEADPAPEFKPLFTAKSYARGLAIYAATWRQLIVCEGESYADGPNIAFEAVPGGADFAADPSEMTPEALALIGELEGHE